MQVSFIEMRLQIIRKASEQKKLKNKNAKAAVWRTSSRCSTNGLIAFWLWRIRSPKHVHRQSNILRGHFMTVFSCRPCDLGTCIRAVYRWTGQYWSSGKKAADCWRLHSRPSSPSHRGYFHTIRPNYTISYLPSKYWISYMLCKFWNTKPNFAGVPTLLTNCSW